MLKKFLVIKQNSQSVLSKFYTSGKQRSDPEIVRKISKFCLKFCFVTIPIRCKKCTSVNRRHIQYKICDNTVSAGYNADIILAKKIH